MINTIPRTQFCKKCSNRNTPTHRGNCNKNLYTKITFLDWEKYLEGKSYNGKRCDLILDRESETTLFIEHKVKDWFDLRKYFPKDQKKEYALTHPKEAQKLIKKRINELSNDLTQKITDTVKKYIEDNFPLKKGKYIVVYSKKHSFNWKEEELNNSQIKQLIQTRILKHSYTIEGYKIAATCLQCDKLKIKNNI